MGKKGDELEKRMKVNRAREQILRGREKGLGLGVGINDCAFL